MRERFQWEQEERERKERVRVVITDEVIFNWTPETRVEKAQALWEASIAKIDALREEMRKAGDDETMLRAAYDRVKKAEEVGT